MMLTLNLMSISVPSALSLLGIELIPADLLRNHFVLNLLIPPRLMTRNLALSIYNTKKLSGTKVYNINGV